MNCTISSGRRLACKDVAGGIKTLYVADYGTLGALTISGGELTAISGTPTLYEFPLYGANNLETAINQDEDAGTTFTESTLNLNFSKLDADTSALLYEIVINRPHVFIEDNNGDFYAVGANRGCNTSGGTFATGTALGDASGYTLVLNAKEKFLPYKVGFDLSTYVDNTGDIQP